MSNNPSPASPLVASLRAQNQELEQLFQGPLAVLEEAASTLEAQAHTIADLEAQIATHKMVLNQYSENLNVRDATIAELKAQVRELQKFDVALEVVKLQEQLTAREATITELCRGYESLIARVERVKAAGMRWHMHDGINVQTTKSPDGYPCEDCDWNSKVQDAAQEGT